MARGVAPLLPGQFGPPVAGGRRRRHGHLNWRRLFVFLTSFTLVVALSAGAAMGALVWYGEAKLRRVPVPELARPGDTDGDGDVDIREISGIRNVLVVGSDSREDLSEQERRRLHLGQFEGIRTDTMILVQLDPDRDAAAMLSFPRDLLVERCDGSEGRINGAYEIGVANKTGGPSCLVETITRLTKIPVHHYVEVDFSGFVQFVDRLGGVRMYIDQPIVDEDANVNLKKGCQVLDGQEALGFVRVRKIDSDFGRIARQQRFIREVVEQLTSARVALDVPRLFRLVAAGAAAVETDSSLSLGLMRRIAFSFRELSSDRIDSRTVPAYNRDINGASYVVPDTERADKLFAAFAAGEAAPRGLGTRGPRDVRIADVPPVVVSNATGRGGLATNITRALRRAGFTVSGTQDEPTLSGRTVVAYPQGRKEEATLLAKAIGGAQLVRVTSGGIRLVLGDDLRPARAVAALERQARQAEKARQEPQEEPTPDFAGATARRSC